jgi:hypothetical protein
MEERESEIKELSLKAIDSSTRRLTVVSIASQTICMADIYKRYSEQQ